MTPTDLERAQQARITALERGLDELERRLAEMEKMYDKVAADLIEALDVASAYRSQATEKAFEAERLRTVADYRQQVNERRNGVERRTNTWTSTMPEYVRRTLPERRKSWSR